MKKLNPFLESPNLPLSTANRLKIYINNRLQNHRCEMLMFPPKNAWGINNYVSKCTYIFQFGKQDSRRIYFKNGLTYEVWTYNCTYMIGKKM